MAPRLPHRPPTLTELVDSESDAQPRIRVASSLEESDEVLGVQAPVLGITTGPAVTTDAPGTHQQYLRGLVAIASRTGAKEMELVLSATQLAGSGVLQAILLYIAVNPQATNVLVIYDGTVTETFTFRAAWAAPFDVAIGVNEAATMANLITAINTDSTLWAAEASAFSDYFVAVPATTITIRRAVASANADRLYGTLTGPADIPVASFDATDYTVAASTEAALPAADPAAKTFGLGRLLADLRDGESHICADDSVALVWDETLTKWYRVEGFADVEAILTAIYAKAIARDELTSRAPLVLTGAFVVGAELDISGRRHVSIMQVFTTGATGAIDLWLPEYMIEVSYDGTNWAWVPTQTIIAGLVTADRAVYQHNGGAAYVAASTAYNDVLTTFSDATWSKMRISVRESQGPSNHGTLAIYVNTRS